MKLKCENEMHFICANPKFLCTLEPKYISANELACPICKRPMEIDGPIVWCNWCMCGWSNAQ